ncbi:MAG: hypothetical protein KatS3mg105_1367 [Gemmatales bacterium]|nr:MAG: hypothetical protein KatS3mg105_1367 [Gemmatales bacterium]
MTDNPAVQKCHKCSRINPPDAVYCYFDGMVLSGQSSAKGPVNMAMQPFPVPFVFPSGRTCGNFDQLVKACNDEWSMAREVFKEGDLAAFLAGMGRSDLARAAREAAKGPDLDRGLDEFLSRLPCSLPGPKLYVEPREINLGQLRPGEDRKFELCLSNRGSRLIYGSIVCQDAIWLSFHEARAAQRKIFQFTDELVIPVYVRSRKLSASLKELEAKIVVNTSGGSEVIVVRASVQPKPFPSGVLAGALTPRQLAEKAKARPKEAAVFFENGAVANWYRENGWRYPVRGPASSGLGAVQQYFEAHGLAKPPKVQIDQQRVSLSGSPGSQVVHSLEVRTHENRSVYALAASSADWLKVRTPPPKGRTASVQLIANVPHRLGETLQARVLIQANGNQRFIVPVTLAVDAGAKQAPRASVGDPPQKEGNGPYRGRVPRPVSQPPAAILVADSRDDRYSQRPPSPNWLLHLFPAGILLLVLCGMFVRDAFQKDPFAQEPDIGLIDTAPRIDIILFDTPFKLDIDGRTERFEPTMTFGLKTRDNKKLTYFENGLSNNTCIRIDGREFFFGHPPGKFVVMREALAADRAGEQRRGYRSVFRFDDSKIEVTQTVELVPGQTSRLLDTCLATYKIDNRDNRVHHVGLRFMLDTYIGRNDGVPFVIPGERELCNTFRVFSRPSQVPDFIQAQEYESLKNPGTIAHLQLKVGGRFEPPSRVTLGAWPNVALRKKKLVAPELAEQCKNQLTGWDVPVLPMKLLNDSAVVMYWAERDLAAGSSRELAFTYGLGDVEADEQGRLGLTIAGELVAGKEFTVTAQVAKPFADEVLTIELLDKDGNLTGALSLTEGEPTQNVPPVSANASTRRSVVSWRVKASRRDIYTIRVRSNHGVMQTKIFRITDRSLFD